MGSVPLHGNGIGGSETQGMDWTSSASSSRAGTLPPQAADGPSHSQMPGMATPLQPQFTGGSVSSVNGPSSSVFSHGPQGPSMSQPGISMQQLPGQPPHPPSSSSTTQFSHSNPPSAGSLDGRHLSGPPGVNNGMRMVNGMIPGPGPGGMQTPYMGRPGMR